MVIAEFSTQLLNCVLHKDIQQPKKSVNCLNSWELNNEN